VAERPVLHSVAYKWEAENAHRRYAVHTERTPSYLGVVQHCLLYDTTRQVASEIVAYKWKVGRMVHNGDNAGPILRLTEDAPQEWLLWCPTCERRLGRAKRFPARRKCVCGVRTRFYVEGETIRDEGIYV